MLNSITTNLIIQYIVVGVILAGAVVWVVWKTIQRRKGKSGGACCGCALSDHCSGQSSHSKTRKRDSVEIHKECPERRDCCK